jgi:hypothetical protein
MENLLQFLHTSNAAWKVFNLDPGIGIAGNPVISSDPGEFSVFARGVDGRLLQFLYAGNGEFSVFARADFTSEYTRWSPKEPDRPPELLDDLGSNWCVRGAKRVECFAVAILNS